MAKVLFLQIKSSKHAQGVTLESRELISRLLLSPWCVNIVLVTGDKRGKYWTSAQKADVTRQRQMSGGPVV